MNFFFSGAFWGILLVLWGASLILKELFPKLHFPFGTIFVALCVIIFGVQLLMSSMGYKGKLFSKNQRRGVTETYRFEDANIPGEELNAIFSSGSMDMSNVDVSNGSRKFEVNAVFGGAKLYLSPETPVVIESSSIFGTVKKSSQINYSSDKNSNCLFIEANAVFGSVEILTKK